MISNIPKQKILFIIQKRCKTGATQYLLNIAIRLQQKYDVEIASAYSSSWKDIVFLSPYKTVIRERIDNIPIYHFAFSFRERVKLFFIFPVLIILRSINKNKYRLRLVELISNGYKKEIKKKSKNMDIIYAFKAQLPYFLLAWQKNCNKPFILSPLIHSMDSWSQSIESKMLYQNSTKLLVSTEHEKKWLINHGIEASKIEIIGLGLFLAPGIEPNPQGFKEKYNLGGNIVLFMGRKRIQKHDKGWKELLKAAPLVWKRRPRTNFIFIGSTDEKTKRIFKAHKDKRIFNLNWVSEQEKVNALAACNIFVMPSASESFGETFLEAWHFKKPVLGADIKVSEEIIENGKCGFVARKEPFAIAEKIIILLDSPDLQKKMGEKGYQKLANYYNWNKIISKIETIAKEVNK